MTKSAFLRHRKTRNQRRRKSRRASRASKRSRRHRQRGGYLGFGIQPYATVIRRPIEDDPYAAPITTLYKEVEEKDVIP
jgi:hypothetical protein